MSGSKDEWDDAAFRARVTAIAEAQRRSLREVCLTAHLTGDYLSKTTHAGRNVRAIFALARSLKVPSTDLLFDSPPIISRVDSALLRRLSLIGHLATHLYMSLDTERTATAKEADLILRQLMRLIEAPDPEQPESRKPGQAEKTPSE